MKRVLLISSGVLLAIFVSLAMVWANLPRENIAAGQGSVYGLNLQDKLFTAGRNEAGQLGRSTGNFLNGEMALGGPLASSNVLAIAAGVRHGIALLKTGEVLTWGGQEHGSSDGDINSTQAHNFSSPVAWVRAGAYSSFVYTQNQQLWVRGRNIKGQLGLGDITDRATWTMVSSLPPGNLQGLSAGIEHTLLLISGNVYGCGSQGFGQLGGTPSAVPVTNISLIDDSRVYTRVQAGGFHSLALDSNQKAWAWGKNHRGQLGLGTVTLANQPTEVQGLNSMQVLDVAAGHGHSLFLVATASGPVVYAAGDNENGQLGLMGLKFAMLPTLLPALPDSAYGSSVDAVAGGPYTSVLLYASQRRILSFGQRHNGTVGPQASIFWEDLSTAADFWLSESTLSVNANGGTGIFMVGLTAPPASGNVVNMSVNSSNTIAIMLSPSALTFTSANWNQTQTVSVTGGAMSSETVNLSVSINSGSDAAFVGIASKTVSVSLQLNQVAFPTSTYVIIDVSGGPSASSYPISSSNIAPDLTGADNLQFKTDKIVLRRIPAGTFMMGSPVGEVGRDMDNETLHPVTLTKDFYIGIFEITQKHWLHVMGTTPSNFSGNTRPVERVSWDTVRGGTWAGNSRGSASTSSFIGQLAVKTGLAIDLPTEAQWEYACRAGTTTSLSSGQSLSSTLQDSAMEVVGRYGYNNGNLGGIVDGVGGYSSNHTTVGSYASNPWGLYDMYGNVSEWCLDWYATSLGLDPVTDPMGLSTALYRLLRGGSWNYEARYCRSASRHFYDPTNGYEIVGFRLSLPVNDSNALPTLAIALTAGNTLIGVSWNAVAGIDNTVVYWTHGAPSTIMFSGNSATTMGNTYVIENLANNQLVHVAVRPVLNLAGFLSATASATPLSSGVDDPFPETEFSYDFANDNRAVYTISAMELDAVGDVYVTGANTGGRYVAKVSTNGAMLWSDDTHGGYEHGITSEGINGYAIGWGGPVKKYRLSGDPLAVSAGGDGAGYQIDADTNGNIYLVHNDGVRSLAPDLSVRWTFTIPNGTHAGGHIMSQVLVGEDGYVYFVGVDWTSRVQGFVYKLNANTGATVWSNYANFNTGTNAQDAMLAVLPDGTVYVSTGTYTICFDSDGLPVSGIGGVSGTGIRNIGSHEGQLYGSTNYSTFQYIHPDLSVAQNFPGISIAAAASVRMNDRAIYVAQGKVINKVKRPKLTSTSPLNAPKGLALTAGNTLLGVSWNAVAGADNTTLYWSHSSNRSLLFSSNTVTVTGNTYVITGLPNGANVYAAVRSRVSGNLSFLSAAVSATPSAGGGDYLLVDVSAGPSALSYPVTVANLSTADLTGASNLTFKTNLIVLRYIPAGTFTMGSPVSEVGRDSTAEAQHAVTLTRDFYMGVFELTQQQYLNVVASYPAAQTYTTNTMPLHNVSYSDIRGLGNTGATYDYPNSGNAVDSSKFMGLLRSKSGLATLDLPTEAQWEYACRAETTGALNNGAANVAGTSTNVDDPNLQTLGWYDWNANTGGGGLIGSVGTREVGAKLPNSWGLFDMHGNLWEWTLDWYVANNTSTTTNPVGPSSGSGRVMRGGSWASATQHCRSADRFDYSPSDRYDYLGFRLALPAGQ